MAGFSDSMFDISFCLQCLPCGECLANLPLPGWHCVHSIAHLMLFRIFSLQFCGFFFICGRNGISIICIGHTGRRETLFLCATKWFNFGIENSIAARKTNDWAKLRFEWKVCGIRIFIWYLLIYFLFCTIKIKLTHIKKNKLCWFDVVFFSTKNQEKIVSEHTMCAR